ncbi:MAG: aldo/keto reductase [Pseudoxanthomonas sp.]
MPSGFRRVNDKVKVTALGFGAAPIGNLYTEVSDRDAATAVQHAWAQGIRYFDTAPYYGYGLSEQRLGAALAQFPRDSYALSTKVGRQVSRDARNPVANDGFAVEGSSVFDYSRDGILRSVEASQRRLGTDYIDMLLLHDIGAETHGEHHAEVMRQVFDETLPALAELKREGVCGAIGLGVNEQAVCLEVMPVFPLDCIMIAGRYTLLEQSGSSGLLAAASKHAVAILAAGPYNSGLLSNPESPGVTYNYVPVDAVTLSKANALYRAAQECDVEVGSAALQFPLAHPAVASVVVGMRSGSEAAATVSRANARIPSSFWQELKYRGLLPEGAITP